MPATQLFARIRATEFTRLAESHHAYLDHTGSTLYPESLVRSHAARLATGILGNPHSENPASQDSTEEIELARDAVLRFFSADPDEYAVCFVANATAAVKLVAESFPFRPDSRFVLSADNHNSVNGIREFAARRGADVVYLPLTRELRLANPLAYLPDRRGRPASLLAFPAQSNFSGVLHPLDLIDAAHERGYTVLLDAAAYAPTHPLHLGRVGADFVAISFYKMFGYPTGIGALIARREALAELERPWFSGGAVDFVSVGAGMHQLRNGEPGFEDGTPNFLGLGAVAHGLAFLAEIGLEAIEAHVLGLCARMLEGLTAIRYPNGFPAVRIYGPTSLQARGATVAFNLLDPDGDVVPYETLVAAAGAEGISLRGGCFCNPGASEAAFAYDVVRLRACLEQLGKAFTHRGLSECMGGAPVGAVRASLGLSSNEEDVERLLILLRRISEDRIARTPLRLSGDAVA